MPLLVARLVWGVNYYVNSILCTFYSRFQFKQKHKQLFQQKERKKQKKPKQMNESFTSTLLSIVNDVVAKDVTTRIWDAWTIK